VGGMMMMMMMMMVVVVVVVVMMMNFSRAQHGLFTSVCFTGRFKVIISSLDCYLGARYHLHCLLPIAPCHSDSAHSLHSTGWPKIYYLGLAINEFSGLVFSCPDNSIQCTISGDEVIKKFNFAYTIETCAWALVVFSFSSLIAAYFVLLLSEATTYLR
jgi:hypothetical protein